MQRKTLKYVILFILILVILRTITRTSHLTFSRDIPLNRYHITLKKGEKFTLKAYSVSFVSYRSEDFRVASVTPGGTVYAHQKGTTYIVVSTKKHTAYCKVKVR